MVRSQYADDTFHPVRAGVVQKVLENPNDPAPRLVLSDWLEDKGHPLEVPQLLREEPGHWEIRNNRLYWVLDEPFSAWTRAYVAQCNEEALRDGWEPLDESPFKWVGVVERNPRCFGGDGKHSVGTGRWLFNRRTGGGAWICINCHQKFQKLAEVFDNLGMTPPNGW